ncbi:MAG: type II toxin-antitoxin system RelE/ParE family toxin [Caldilineaceae bacterium]
MDDDNLILQVRFYRTVAGNEPVREWLSRLSLNNRKVIGKDIKTVQFSWPLGMPLVRKIAPNLWEVRSSIQDGIARVLFTVVGRFMVLLHGFIKKSQKTPQSELATAQRRLIEVQQGGHYE